MYWKIKLIDWGVVRDTPHLPTENLPDSSVVSFTSTQYCKLKWVIIVYCQLSNFSAISSWWEQVNFQWDADEVCFVLDQHVQLDFYSTSSLKQQSVDRHLTPLWYIIIISSQPVFALSPKCWVFSEEATNTNFIGFFLLQY